jgi:apolipoprotein N-acyltransferase
MARATNTGISALIDQHGRIVARSRLFVSEIVQGVIQPLHGTTPYVLLGDWPILALSGMLLITGFVIVRNREYTASPV